LKKQKKVGVTGGIGAGKSIVCRILSAMGYPVFNSDLQARSIINTDPSVKKEVISLFGEEAYHQNELDRKYIAKCVFNNKSLLTQLNNIVHPAVRREFSSWAKAQDASLVFNEAAILFETGTYKQYDAMLLVTASESTRIERVMERDQVSEEEVRKRMNKQWADEKKIPLADFCIENDKEKMLIPQVLETVSKLLES